MFVQANSAVPQTAQAQVAQTYSRAQSAGDLNVAIVGWQDTNAQVTSVTDTRGNVYQLAIGPTKQTNRLSQSIYYAKNIVAASLRSNTVSVGFSAAANFVDLRILEYRGIDPNSPLESAIGASGDSVTSDSGLMNTSNANDLLVAGNVVITSTASAGPNFTSRLITRTDADIAEDRVVTTLGAYNASAPLTSSGPWVMQMAAFKATSSGGSGSGGSGGSGGVVGSGGSRAAGGTSSVGGVATSGGASTTGGSKAAGGTSSTGGTRATGGNSPTGGSTAAGGNNPTGGAQAAGGSQASCSANCSGKQCGSDGCTGICGGCLANQLCSSAGTCQTSAGSILQVDATSGLTPISPAIYGVAFADAKTLSAATLHRFGGDCASMYNWKVDAFNCGQDWQFTNQALLGFGYPPYNLSGVPAGMSGIDWLTTFDRQNKVDTLVTVPTIGWVAKDKSSAGDSSGSNPSQDAVQADGPFMQQWVQHLVDTFGRAGAGGVKYYQLDNEDDNWSHMHSDVHPKAASANEIWTGIQTYGGAIKAVDPSAFVAINNPATLEALIYSPLDETNFGSDEPFVPPALDLKSNTFSTWLLKQAAAYEKQHGVRVMDCLDMHYPTAGSNPVQDVRSLWDPSYNENSWLTLYAYNGPIQILPRLQQWINANYPGTGICISEYQYYPPTGNGSPDYSGVTEADALGIFGKYGLKLAAYWTRTTDTSGNITPTWTAFAMYRNYDGAGAHFGDYSVGASSATTDVTIYGAVNSPTLPTTLWVMIINKTTNVLSNQQLQINHFTNSGIAHMYQATASNAPIKLADVAMSNGSVTVSLPALSINLLVVQ